MAPSRQLGLLWGGVAACCAALAPLAPAIVAGLPSCPFKALLGLPCAACGSARAALALARLDPGSAFGLNPLAAAGWILLVAGGLLAGGAALAGRGVPEPRANPSPALRLAGAGMILANWLYLIGRGV